ncbi:Tll0287-like domain-containing protein [Marinimicrococcus flavescens]|uniref:DUF3365 domain-containing protein n=1 Tax=Marinimicrococcus flavescens TaxID=3031815 RepID=A0AAP4D5J8_9PROT|nr:DUF3365 domain-containing protein [Marinimicrococcus flavescens]
MRCTRKGLLVLGVVAACAAAAASADNGSERAIGERLAGIIGAGRSVVSSHQGLINDPDIGEKNLTGERVVAEAVELYEKRRGEPPVTEGMKEGERRLVEAALAAMREIVDENEALIDMKGLGFKGFLPATYTRLVNERFAEKVGSEARVKFTAPPELVRNRKARPDAWEQRVLASELGTPGWPMGEPYTEAIEVEGRPAFRMLIPEYYSASCLSCHGEPKGQTDVTGYPKEGGREGDLGGATSITLFR